MFFVFYFKIINVSPNIYNAYFYKVYEYQTPRPFLLLRNSDLLGALYLMGKGILVALSILGGIINFPTSYLNSGDHSSASNYSSVLLILFMTHIIGINRPRHAIEKIIDGGGRPFRVFSFSSYFSQYGT